MKIYKQLIDVHQRPRFRIAWLNATRKKHNGVAIQIFGWEFGVYDFPNLRRPTKRALDGATRAEN